MSQIALLIPFYNERRRLQLPQITQLSKSGEGKIDCYFVDDGSTDGYSEEITRWIKEESLPNIYLIDAKCNRGKSEAIRHGALSINMTEYQFMGITDADFSASPIEIMRLATIAIEENTCIFGARVSRRDNNIQTSKFRYTQGMIFNKLVELILGYRFLDSQCGLKFFPVSSNLIASLEKPFVNRWLFDLEMVLRLNRLEFVKIQSIVLKEWRHSKGSKTSVRDVGPIILSILSLRAKYGKFFRVEEEYLN
jgi:glycosyltransferase involved in cell wall biosynthesis